MKKKIMKALSVMLAVVITITASPLSGFVGLELPEWLDLSINASAATSGTCGENLTWTFDESTGTLTISGTGAMSDSSSRCQHWDGCSYDIKTVVISNGVTSIGKYAFYNNIPCGSLTSVTIPDSVTSIGDYAFTNCPNLTSITIPDSVTTIGNSAFYSCDSLTSVTIPDSVTYIGSRAFQSCDSLTSVTIGNGVTSIGISVFEKCTNLTSITFPDGLTRIGYRSFLCTSLTSITIPDSVTYIETQAFYNCTNLTVIIPESVTYIGSYAFYNCKSVIRLSSDDKISFSNDIYTCLVGETFYISGDINAAEDVGSISLSWTSGDGVELNLPASVINDSDTHASFSVQAKGIEAGFYTVRVTGNNNRSDSCQVKVIEPKSDLVVSVEKTIDTDYYCAGDTLVDYNLNEHDSISFKVTVKNKLSDECAGMSLTDEVKEKLKINNISVDSSLDDYSSLSVDIADLTDLKNIGTLEVGEEEVITFDIYPLKLEGKEISANLNLTAIADDKEDISKSVPILIKDKLYDPYIGVTFTVDQEVIYKDKKYDAESVPVILKITNKIPSDFNGDISKLKQLSGYDITVTGAKLTVDNADLFKSTSVNATTTNKTLKPGETITLEGYLNIKTNHKMPDDVEYESANISYNVTSSANTCTGSKEIIFVNQDFDYKKNWRVQTLEELILQMESLLSQCHVITPAEKILVAEILDAIQLSSNLGDMSKQLDGLECIYDLSCYATGLKNATAKTAGKLIVEKIKDECTNASDVLKNEVEDTLKTLTNSEAFNEFAYWYYNELKVNEGEAKKTNAHCPIDITVTDENGNVVLSIVNDEIVVSTGDIAVFVCEGEKTFYLPTDKSYNVTITATGNGTMDYSVVERASDGELRVVSYDDITLATGDSFEGEITNESLPVADEYNLTKNNNTEIQNNSVTTNEHLHSYLLDSTIPSTCTQTGMKTFVCTLCDKTRTEEVALTGHNHKSVVTAPTCTNDGYTTYSCDCGDTYISDYVDALGHSFENGSCKVCGEIDTSIPEYPEYNYTFSIQAPSTTSIRHKDGIKLHTKVEGTAPAGVYVVWTASNENFKTEEINNGNSLKIVSDKNGTTTFTATLYSADGDVLATDTIEMKSKAGFFDKIGSFFRSLFGGTKIYEN